MQFLCISPSIFAVINQTLILYSETGTLAAAAAVFLRKWKAALLP